MKKSIFILIVMVIFLIPIKAYGNDEVNIDDEQMSKINGLYDYISNLDTGNELLKDMSPKKFVQNYMKGGQDI